MRASGSRIGRIVARVRGFIAARSGSTAVEYGVITALVSTAIVASLSMIAGPLGQLLAGIGTSIASN